MGVSAYTFRSVMVMVLDVTEAYLSWELMRHGRMKFRNRQTGKSDKHKIDLTFLNTFVLKEKRRISKASMGRVTLKHFLHLFSTSLLAQTSLFTAVMQKLQTFRRAKSQTILTLHIYKFATVP